MTQFDTAKHALITSLESGTHEFGETLAFVDQWFEFTPSGFSNGPIRNESNENQGSCKVLALAEQLQLSHQQLLYCFGEHYRDVLATPDVENHFNLRHLVASERTETQFDQFPLERKTDESHD